VRSLALLLLLAAAGPAAAQGSRPDLYVGPGLYPGTGAVVIASRPFFTAVAPEAALYADYQPRVLGGRGRLIVAAGAGGALRLVRILEIARGTDTLPGIDLDAGARLGPAFYYAFFEQTAEAEARAFRVMFDPFVRGSLPVRGRRLFVELGTQEPRLRAGLAL
jgi:hypothetical protein